MFNEDRTSRLAVAQEYLDHGEVARCFLHPADGSLLGLSAVNDRLLTIALNAANKNPSSKRYSLSQLYVFRSDANDDTYGKIFVRIQGNLHYVNAVGDNQSAFFDIGIVETPQWKTRVGAYDSKTGEALQKITVLDSFKDQYNIPYSKELIESLRPHFGRTSFVFKEANGKKWSVTQEDLLDDFDQVINRYKPKHQYQDGSVR